MNKTNDLRILIRNGLYSVYKQKLKVKNYCEFQIFKTCMSININSNTQNSFNKLKSEYYMNNSIPEYIINISNLSITHMNKIKEYLITEKEYTDNNRVFFNSVNQGIINKSIFNSLAIYDDLYILRLMNQAIEDNVNNIFINSNNYLNTSNDLYENYPNKINIYKNILHELVNIRDDYKGILPTQVLVNPDKNNIQNKFRFKTEDVILKIINHIL